MVVTYQDGDTFGYSTGNVHIEGAYKDSDEADKVLKSIKENEYKGYMPWAGHFESLEHVEIHVFTVTKYDENKSKYIYHL